MPISYVSLKTRKEHLNVKQCQALKGNTSPPVNFGSKVSGFAGSIPNVTPPIQTFTSLKELDPGHPSIYDVLIAI